MNGMQINGPAASRIAPTTQILHVLLPVVRSTGSGVDGGRFSRMQAPGEWICRLRSGRVASRHTLNSLPDGCRVFSIAAYACLAAFVILASCVSVSPDTGAWHAGWGMMFLVASLPCGMAAVLAQRLEPCMAQASVSSSVDAGSFRFVAGRMALPVEGRPSFFRVDYCSAASRRSWGRYFPYPCASMSSSGMNFREALLMQ